MATICRYLCATYGKSMEKIAAFRIAIYRVLTTGEAYMDEGDEAVFQRNSKAREGAMIRALERSVYTITKAQA